MGEERRKPDPRRTHRPPDLAGPQFPLWTKGACDSLYAPNRELTHSGLFLPLSSGAGVRAWEPRARPSALTSPLRPPGSDRAPSRRV